MSTEHEHDKDEPREPCVGTCFSCIPDCTRIKPDPQPAPKTSGPSR